jgi:predicted RNase H-like HicB family nuclease
MNPIKFTSEDNPEVLWACGKCGVLYTSMQDKETAEEKAAGCCAPNICECGAECRRFRLSCDACSDRKHRLFLYARYKDAEKLSPADWEGPVYDPHGDRYYRSLEDMMEDLESDGATAPLYVHPCTETAPSLDLSSILDDAAENLELEESEELVWEGVEVLEQAVKTFNEAQTYRVWYPMLSQVIDLNNEPERYAYHYMTEWSEEDQVFVANVFEFPSLAAHGSNHDEARKELVGIVRAVVNDLEESGEPVPQPSEEDEETIRKAMQA